MHPEPATLRVTLPSDTSYLHLVANLARNAAAAAGLEQLDADQVALATDEAVSNVIRHAYHGHAGHTVEIVVSLHADRLEVCVIHDGDPVDHAILDAQYDPEQHVRERRRGGLGVVLMRRLMDQVDYTTTDDHRSVCCLKKFKRPRHQETSGAAES